MLKTVGGWAHAPIQSYYRVDSLRRLLPEDRKEDKQANLVQFWGLKLSRRWNPDTGAYSMVWDVGEDDYMHTVDIREVLVILNPNDPDWPFEEE